MVWLDFVLSRFHLKFERTARVPDGAMLCAVCLIKTRTRLIPPRPHFLHRVSLSVLCFMFLLFLSPLYLLSLSIPLFFTFSGRRSGGASVGFGLDVVICPGGSFALRNSNTAEGGGGECTFRKLFPA